MKDMFHVVIDIADMWFTLLSHFEYFAVRGNYASNRSVVCTAQ